ncbi:Glycosyltransferase involved in cell wall biogenesis [Sphingomonas sp. KC8]|nr:Glycosyltransferase involved in cell wall biogenesis [Sphingomonas sp. KC8]
MVSETDQRVRELELLLVAQRDELQDSHKILWEKNAELTIQMESLRSLSEKSVSEAESARKEADFLFRQLELNNRISRHLHKFRTEESEKRIKFLRGIVDEILQQDQNDSTHTKEKGSVFSGGVLNRLLTTTNLPSHQNIGDIDFKDVLVEIDAPKELKTLCERKTVCPHDLLTDSIREEAAAAAREAEPRVSVIMPTYNRATTIVQAIRSALDQSLPPKEIIVADDESTDNTLELIRDAFPQEITDARLILLACEKGGVCKMRNEALRQASGNFIAYLDSDNVWHRDHLLWAIACLHARQAKSAYTGANIHHLGEDWSRVDFAPYDRTNLLRQNFIDLNCFVHRAELYRLHGGFDTALTRLVDWDFIIRLTRDEAPVQIPVSTVEYFLDKAGLGNISFTQSLEDNAAKIQIKHREEMRAHNILSPTHEARLDEVQKRLDASAEAPIREATPTPVPASTNEADTGASTPVEQHELAYFGGLDLFIALPPGVTVPQGLPVDFIRARWLSVQADGQWAEILANGTIVPGQGAMPDGSYWCPDLRQTMPTPHQLATLVAATELTEIDAAIASYTLEAAPKIGIACFRNQIVLRAPIVGDFLHGHGIAPGATLKVLRIPEGNGNDARLADLSGFLGAELVEGTEKQYFGIGHAPKVVALRNSTHRRDGAPKSEGRPRVLILAQKLAVGGVERNTIEVARELSATHDCLYMTLEKIHPEQGSLCHQATAACAHVLDLAEIATHRLYPALMEMIVRDYAPDNLWICNGSMWLSQNAGMMRNLFQGIVDQQVYDTDAGWINHYSKPEIQSFDRFIAINNKILEKFVSHFDMPMERIDLIYSAINADRFRRARQARLNAREQRIKFGLPIDKTLFTFMGRLVDQKRPLDFLEIARMNAQHTDWHFVLVGNGVLAPQVENFLKIHPMDNFTWIQNIDDTTQYWPAVDAYVVTSEYEGLPIALLEAISLGVPVISTDVGDIRHVLDLYDAGRVVPSIGFPEDFNDALQEFATNIVAMKDSLSVRGDEIIDFFSAEAICGQFSESFRKARTISTAKDC